MDRIYHVYIMTNITNNVLYVGVTNNLQRRVFEHKHKLLAGFSKRHRLCKLVHYESTTDVRAAIAR